MKADRRDFERLERSFYDALDVPEGEAREAFVAEACATDPQHGEELRALLENHRSVRDAGSPQPLPRFGVWQAVRKLGNGGMGDVYLAERADGAFEMTAAVKVAPLAIAWPQIEERFLAERQLLARLSHPGITRLLDGGVTPAGLPYFVMEFIDGKTIDRYAASHSLGARERIGLLRQMLEALAYVHSQQVLHRDLKPSNVLVDAAGRVKLCDFGIAQLMVSGNEAAAIPALTPDYASPEQARGEAVSVRSDIYSAGVLMRKLLAGQRRGRGLEAIIGKATAEDPKLRFASAAEMDSALGRYLEGRRTVLRWLAAAVVVGIGLAAMPWRGPRAEAPSVGAHAAPGSRQWKPYVAKPAAQELVKEGEAALQLATPESGGRAEALFRRAAEIDPGYAVAYARQAAAIWDRSGHLVRGRSEEDRKELLRLARKSVELDPDAAMPHVLLAAEAMQYDWDWDEAETEMKLAVSARDADASAFANYALLLLYRGRGAEGEEWMDRALRVDSHGFAALINASNFYYFRGETAKQIRCANALIRAYPGDLSAQIQEAIADVLDRRAELAWPIFRSVGAHSVNGAIVEAWTRAMAGEREEALRLIRPYEEQYPNIDFAMEGLAVTYGWLNDERDALKWLERSADAREWQVLNVAVNPAFRGMEDTPGFHEFKKRLRLEGTGIN